ncbi:type II toxin-antitoxin system RelE/ParE family toxin [Klebsiella pneumoniae]|uniref:type II toxin-antitoxin system RelE/ParE family toxin n=1 Tax=Klebsiella pneumoniae TaxID=573 RepID=UPI00203BD497|nr:type II toxin-antitoxin system RelE/ParE family toxin [Klebsiella pneumoniae]USB67200.1 type II toxin-antitoxin system RelE/ParE family toxin [Klebsiella pneumoniae]HBT4924905.1 type II toxin-antitoxin system RelE/ParE family toxin [Klebsiella pneumoniae]
MLTLSRQAQQHIRGIQTWSVQHWGRAKARQYISQLRLTMEGLSVNPYSGIDSSADWPDTWRFPCNSHVIYYRPLPDGIIVTAVLHKSQLPARHL